MSGSMEARQGDTVSGRIRADTPKMSRMLAMLLPTTLPRAMSLLPLTPAEILTNSSGADVPKATTVSPTAVGDTCSPLASRAAPSTKRSAPLIRTTKPSNSKSEATNMTVFRHPLDGRNRGFAAAIDPTASPSAKRIF